MGPKQLLPTTELMEAMMMEANGLMLDQFWGKRDRRTTREQVEVGMNPNQDEMKLL